MVERRIGRRGEEEKGTEDWKGRGGGKMGKNRRRGGNEEEGNIDGKGIEDRRGRKIDGNRRGRGL